MTLKSLVVGLLIILTLPLLSMAEDVPLGRTARMTDIMVVDTTGAMASPDSGGPVYCAVTKNTSSAPLAISGLATAMTGLTTSGGFLFTVALTTTNGFAIDDNVNGDCFALVSGKTQGVGKVAYHITAAENSPGVQVVDVGRLLGTVVATPDTAGYFKVTVKDGTGAGEIDTSAGGIAHVILSDTITTYTGNTLQTGDSFARIGATGSGLTSLASTTTANLIYTAALAIKVKTDFLPSIAAGAAGGVFIAGSNAATTVNFTGNLSGSVGSVAGSVVGSVGSIATGGITAGSFGLNAIDANALKPDAADEIAVSVWASTTRQITSSQAFSNTGTWTGNLTGNVGGTVNGFTTTAIANLFNLNSGYTYITSVAGSPVKEIVDNAGGSSLTNNSIATAVWGYLTAVCSGSAGSTCQSLVGAAAASDPLLNAVPGAYVLGTAGYAIGTYLNVAVSTRLAPTVSGRTLNVTAGGFGSINLDDTVGTLAKTSEITGFNDPGVTAISTDVWSYATRILTGSVTVGTNNDKTGYSLSASQTFNLIGNITGNLSGTIGGVVADGITAASLHPSVTTELQNGLATAAALSSLDTSLKSSLAVRQSTAFQWAMKFVDPTTGLDIPAASVTCTRSLDAPNAFSTTAHTASTTTTLGWSELSVETTDVSGTYYTILRCTAGTGVYETVFKIQVP